MDAPDSSDDSLTKRPVQWICVEDVRKSLQSLREYADHSDIPSFPMSTPHHQQHGVTEAHARHNGATEALPNADMNIFTGLESTISKGETDDLLGHSLHNTPVDEGDVKWQPPPQDERYWAAFMRRFNREWEMSSKDTCYRFENPFEWYKKKVAQQKAAADFNRHVQWLCLNKPSRETHWPED